MLIKTRYSNGCPVPKPEATIIILTSSTVSKMGEAIKRKMPNNTKLVKKAANSGLLFINP
jgi:hypothetical protein